MKPYHPILLGGLALLTSLLVRPLLAQEQTLDTEGAAEATAVAYRFLEALSAADTATLAGLLVPQAMIHSLRDGPAGAAIRAVSKEAFLGSLGAEEEELLERMWDPTVLVQDRVAMVWTPYDFHLNGEFSHCGTDVFTLLKGDEGWQVASITYNVVRVGCPPSPLGPPGGRGR